MEGLADGHDRTSFACGEEALDLYFKTQVTQDIHRHVATCFVAVEAATGAVAGFYTLAAASIALSELPAEVAKRLPRYPSLPAIRVGRLAVDRHFRGCGLGGALVADVARRSLRSDVAAYALLVDAKSEDAVAFYEHLAFQRFSSKPRTLYLPLATAKKALGEGTR